MHCQYPELEALIARRIKAGFGQGRGSAYKPWIRVHDFSSRGLSQRIPLRITGRSHHVFSLLEADFLHWMAALEEVRDIREQYPCLPLRDTLYLAHKLGVKHPWDLKQKQPAVMTSDFRVTFAENGHLVDRVYSLKPAAELNDENVNRKLWLEKRFWEGHGIEWSLITEHDIPRVFVQNAKWLHGFWRPESVAPLLPTDVVRIGSLVHEATMSYPDEPIGSVTMRIDQELACAPGMSMKVVRHLVASRRWKVNMDLPLGPSHILPILHFGNWERMICVAHDQSTPSLARR